MDGYDAAEGDVAEGVFFDISVGDYYRVGTSSTTRALTDDGNYPSWTSSDYVYDTSTSDSETNPSKPTSITYGSTEYTYTDDNPLTWDETYVYSVDILLFRAAVSESSDTIYYLRYLQRAAEATSTSLDLSTSYTVAFTGGGTTTLSSSDIYDSDRIYIAANHSFSSSDTYGNYASTDGTLTLTPASSDLSYSDASGDSYTKLSALSALTTNTLTTDYPRGPLGKYLSGSAKYRYPFEMCTFVDASKYSLEYDKYGVAQKKYYDVVLERAMAKLLIHVKYKEYDEDTGAAESTFTELLTSYAYGEEHDIRFRVCNYADKASLIPDGDYRPRVEYGTSGTATTYGTLTDEGTSTDTDDDNHKAADFVYCYTTTSGSTMTVDSTAAVFYFYPNSWVDSVALVSTYGLSNDQPIVSDRQTYVSMTVQHKQSDNRVTEYYYHIPVNYLLPVTNDIAGYGASHYDELAAYYRIDRNTLYEVWVYITELDAGLSVALSIGRGTADEIADLTDDASGSINLEPVAVITGSVTNDDDDDSLIDDLTDSDDDMGSNTTVGTVITNEEEDEE